MSKRGLFYIFFELLPSFFLGMLVFIFIILMFQVLRLTDFALVHGVALSTLAEIVAYICISILPALLPMSLLFSILLTCNRLSFDSEIIALKASGVPTFLIISPALVLGLLIGILSLQTAFKIAPWGNRQFEVLYTKLANSKAAANFKPATFSQSFFNIIIYANDIETKTGALKDVFIYDENSSPPISIIASEGYVVPDSKLPGHKATLRLIDGEIHRSDKAHTKISFKSSEIQLIDPILNKDRDKSLQSLTLSEIKARQLNTQSLEEKTLLNVEFHKRIAISILCLTFAVLGVGLGIINNRRSPKAGGTVLCVGLIVLYWVMYLSFESLARNQTLPVPLAIWAPNFFFLLFGFFSLKKVWN